MVTSRYTVHWRLDVLVQAYNLLTLLHSQHQMHHSVSLNPSRVGVQLIGRVPRPMREQLAIKLAEILNLVTSSNIERVGNVFSCSVITVTTLHLYKRTQAELGIPHPLSNLWQKHSKSEVICAEDHTWHSILAVSSYLQCIKPANACLLGSPTGGLQSTTNVLSIN